MQAIGHRFDEIEAELDALTELRDKPAGTVRITCGDSVLRTVLLPRLIPLLREYPDIKLVNEVNANWDQAQGQQAMQNLLATYPDIDGVIVNRIPDYQKFCQMTGLDQAADS